MAQEVTNFARFYTLFNKLPCTGDREEFKKSIVLQYTWNRTDSLKEMTAKEYEACCTALEELAVKLRSIQRKGGLKPKKEKQTINSVSVVSLIQIDPDAPAN